MLQSMDLKELRALRDRIDDVIPARIAEYTEVIHDLQKRYVYSREEIARLAAEGNAAEEASSAAAKKTHDGTDLSEIKAAAVPETVMLKKPTIPDDEITGPGPHFPLRRGAVPAEDQLTSVRLNVTV